jgi:hypothetical protein
LQDSRKDLTAEGAESAEKTGKSECKKSLRGLRALCGEFFLIKK